VSDKLDLVLDGYCWACDASQRVIQRGYAPAEHAGTEHEVLFSEGTHCSLCGGLVHFAGHLEPGTDAPSSADVPLDTLQARIAANLRGKGWQRSMSETAARVAVDTITTTLEAPVSDPPTIEEQPVPRERTVVGRAGGAASAAPTSVTPPGTLLLT
jgi:hypothetical protein